MSRSLFYSVTAGVLVAACVAGIAFYLGSPHDRLRITAGPVGGAAERFVAAMIAVAKKQNPLVSFEPVETGSLQDSSALLDARKVDLAIVRSDASPPANGQTIVILRRDIAAILGLPKSKVEGLAGLSGKTVIMLASRVQFADEALLDALLGYANVSPQSVSRMIVRPENLGKVLREKSVAAVFAVGPVGAGGLSDIVTTITKSVGAPTLMAFDNADAIANSIPGTESLDLAKGSLRIHPDIPDDSTTVVAVTYRLAAPFSMLNLHAGAIARAILTAKGKLMEAYPQAASIEAPDPDKSSTVLPIHPGVAQYLSSGEQSFLDEAQSYFYAAAMVFSVVGSLWAMVARRLSRKRDAMERNRIGRLIQIADEARGAPKQDLSRLSGELHKTLSEIVEAGMSDPTTALAASHAEAVFAARRQTVETEGRSA
ncbi:TRAP ABC transporter [Alsobacter metallidurans]|uniref:TRAP ABC transporter n=1 Tax=Alsobacter metallidurans TaxID=340221 RepID=A0A917I9V4_9HYPH|nr:C4-dicarboxylate ABC transporter substrate-binding protein [Alsobacter metallidurans]GGH24288.1 TRAP ABC transporter [Alsobacter metallidurans]